MADDVRSNDLVECFGLTAVPCIEESPDHGFVLLCRGTHCEPPFSYVPWSILGWPGHSGYSPGALMPPQTMARQKPRVPRGRIELRSVRKWIEDGRNGRVGHLTRGSGQQGHPPLAQGGLPRSCPAREPRPSGV